MRVKEIRLKDFRGFTDLKITGLSPTSKLIVILGPSSQMLNCVEYHPHSFKESEMTAALTQ